MKVANQKLILDVMVGQGLMSIWDIAHESGLSEAKVRKLLISLKRKGLVMENSGMYERF